MMRTAPASQDRMIEKIAEFDVFLYRRLDALLDALPGRDKRFSLFVLLIIAEIAIAALDVAVGYTISLRPLLVLPVLVSAIYLPRPRTYLLAVAAILLRLESFRISIIPDGEVFPLVLNFIPAFLAYAAVAEFASLAVGTIRELRDYVVTLEGELLLERLGKISKGDAQSPDD